PIFLPRDRPRALLLARMRPHFWLGYGILGLVLAHASVVMIGGAPGADVLALYLATGALFLIAGPLLLPRRLRDPAPSGRRHPRQLEDRHRLGRLARQ